MDVMRNKKELNKKGAPSLLDVVDDNFK